MFHVGVECVSNLAMRRDAKLSVAYLCSPMCGARALFVRCIERVECGEKGYAWSSIIYKYIYMVH